MSMHRPTLTVEKAADTAQVDSNSAKVVPLGKRDRRVAKFKFNTFSNRERSTYALRPRSLKASRGPDGGRLQGRIIDFARQRQSAHIGEKSSSETSLTLVDWLAVAFLVASVAFYPVLVWYLTWY